MLCSGRRPPGSRIPERVCLRTYHFACTGCCTNLTLRRATGFLDWSGHLVLPRSHQLPRATGRGALDYQSHIVSSSILSDILICLSLLFSAVCVWGFALNGRK